MWRSVALDGVLGSLLEMCIRGSDLLKNVLASYEQEMRPRNTTEVIEIVDHDEEMYGFEPDYKLVHKFHCHAPSNGNPRCENSSGQRMGEARNFASVDIDQRHQHVKSSSTEGERNIDLPSKNRRSIMLEGRGINPDDGEREDQ